MKTDYYYLETDGQVFLIKDGKRFRFPRSRREIPCPFEPVFTIPLSGINVLYAHPQLSHHPEHWFHKDHVIGREDIDPIVQRAVNRSLPRGASKVAIIEKGQVLMVLAKRGLTKGMWNLPGGFIGYGEHPEETARREVLEELGLRITLTGLIGVYSELFERTGGYMISFIYLGKRLSKTLRLHPEEMEDARWMPVREAMRITKNPFAQLGFRDYLKQKPHPQPLYRWERGDQR